MRRRTFLDIYHQRFGRLIAERIDHRIGIRNYWACSCDCGKLAIVRQDRLTAGGTRSCGCLYPKAVAKPPRKKRPAIWAWHPWQDECLREWYYKKPIAELSALVGRTKEATWNRARNLGLSKPGRATHITPDQYMAVVTEVAVEMGVRPAAVLSGDFHDRRVSRARHEAWARLRLSGVGPAAIRDASGFDHGSVSAALKKRRLRVGVE